MRGALDLAASRYRADAIEAVELQAQGGAPVVTVLVREGTGATRCVHDASGNLVSRTPSALQHAEAPE
jgi:hypothetical protein